MCSLAARYDIFMQTGLPLGQITQREERIWDKNVKCPKSKFIRICSSRTSTERRKTKKKLFCLRLYSDPPSGRVDYTQREKRLGKMNIENIPHLNSLGSASRRTSTGRRKTNAEPLHTSPLSLSYNLPYSSYVQLIYSVPNTYAVRHAGITSPNGQRD